MSARARLGLALLGSSLASVGLFIAGAINNESWTFGYLIWNLTLAWIPLGLALWLERVLRRKLWSSWEALATTVLWLSFLPNSFYIVTDYVHLQDVQRVDLLFDVVMFSSFVFTGVVLGYISLGIVHKELLKRLSKRISGTFIAAILLVSSFAIYIGRDLRWNSWDILVSPASLIFDVSDRLLNPHDHPQAFITTATFFVFLGTFYIVSRAGVRALRIPKPSE